MNQSLFAGVKYKRLEKRELEEVFARVRGEDQKLSRLAIDRIISSIVPAVWNEAKAWSKRSNFCKADDLYQIGMIGALKAINHFDVSKDLHFLTYAIWWVRAYMRREVESHISILSIGWSTDIRNQIHTGKRTPEFNAIASPYVKLEEMTELGYGDALADMASASPEELLMAKEEMELVRRSVRNAKLNEREKIVARERILAHDRAPFAAIAEGQGVTRERMRQIEVDTLRKIRKSIVNRRLGTLEERDRMAGVRTKPPRSVLAITRALR